MHFFAHQSSTYGRRLTAAYTLREYLTNRYSTHATILTGEIYGTAERYTVLVSIPPAAYYGRKLCMYLLICSFYHHYNVPLATILLDHSYHLLE